MSVSGSAASTAAAKAAPNSAAVQLTWGGEDGTFVAAGHKAEIDAFNKANPGIQVTYVPISAILSDAPAKLQTMIAGGDPPDFFEIGSSYYASVVAKGILLNLGSFIARSEDFNVGDVLSGGLAGLPLSEQPVRHPARRGADCPLLQCRHVSEGRAQAPADQPERC